MPYLELFDYYLSKIQDFIKWNITTRIKKNQRNNVMTCAWRIYNIWWMCVFVCVRTHVLMCTHIIIMVRKRWHQFKSVGSVDMKGIAAIVPGRNWREEKEERKWYNFIFIFIKNILKNIWYVLKANIGYWTEKGWV